MSPTPEPQRGPDAEMLDKVMAQIKAVAVEPFFDHEQGRWLLWDQGQWRAEGKVITSVSDGKPRFYADDEYTEDEITLEYADTSCGTAMCLAGWTAELDPTVRWLHNNTVVDVETGSQDQVEDWAQDRLNLTSWQASALFDGGNSLDDLEDMVERLKAGDDLGEAAHYEAQREHEAEYGQACCTAGLAPTRLPATLPINEAAYNTLADLNLIDPETVYLITTDTNNTTNEGAPTHG